MRRSQPTDRRFLTALLGFEMDGTGPEAPLTSAQETLLRRHCGKPLQHTFIDLGMSPLCESFLTEKQLGEPETYYPLHVRVCDACWLVQLPEFVSPAHIFGYGAPGKDNTLLNY